ncbi:LOW QUALITY PROTEIN: hypothetical protein KUTeg_012001 [Tegillarca granosa]|uniref:Uncharacterized protein n=1 Tax=Tegillarca granosa TaxID=220873 RepID=A0ABQ9F0Z4_TEGGR|nr:LOW QUALITY PROTEIN: hypothetical protein KUTeg_011731 [Tegillarca granosa]KAJ8310136.1 LOW QUALITY PROTEIN: hypothetical protein KUTeg_012001 [Tegillarca granosa]
MYPKTMCFVEQIKEEEEECRYCLCRPCITDERNRQIGKQHQSLLTLEIDFSERTNSKDFGQCYYTETREGKNDI